MAREIFKNLPDTNTPLSATKLNGIFNGEESMGSVVVEDIECKNLLYTPYTEDNKLTITALRDDHYLISDYKCYIEAGEEYAFKCETSGETFGAGSSDVQVILLLDKGFDTTINMQQNPYTFVPTVSGYYYLRIDVNNNGATHSFWNFQIEKGPVATDYVEHKEFDNNNLKTTTKNYEDYITFADGITVNSCYVEKLNNIIYIHTLITYSFIVGTNTIARITKPLKCGGFGSGRVNNGSQQYPATVTSTSGGEIRLYSITTGIDGGFTIMLMLDEESNASSVSTTSLEETE